MAHWSRGNWYEKRASAAALAGHRLLDRPKYAKQARMVLDKITASMEEPAETRKESFKALRKSMGYCWNILVAALPETGKPRMES